MRCGMELHSTVLALNCSLSMDTAMGYELTIGQLQR